MAFRSVAVTLVALATATEQTRVVSQWDCAELKSRQLTEAVQWRQVNCSSNTPSGQVGPITFNIVATDLASESVVARPVVATTPLKVQATSSMAAQTAGALAAVNGGYFYRVDEKLFFDDVCLGKLKSEALQNASVEHPNYGVGDGLTVVNGELMASNCDTLLYNRPTALLLKGTESYIQVMQRAERAPAGTVNAIAAGPNLVSWDSSKGEAYVDIPLDDLNVNILEHSANTAVGVVREPSCAGKAEGCQAASLVMVTVDGHDGCKRSDTTCGTTSHRLAYFMKDYLKCSEAMGMDQGGSTTMWVSGEGVVSNPTQGERLVYNALFVASRARAGEQVMV